VGWARPDWTDDLGISWADEEGVSKLLGAPFGISLSTANVDDFLLEKMSNKLTRWSATKINATGRSVVVNSILLLSMFYFMSIWGGTKQGIKRIKLAVMNYLAAGTMQRSRIRISWIQCCQSKAEGGLNIINPEDAMVGLMTKWILKAMEPGTTNLHLLLRFRLMHYQPFQNGNWQPSLEYFTKQGHQARRGSIVWNRISTAWKIMINEVEFVRPNNREELASCSFWHCPLAPTIGPGFSKIRAMGLHRNGLRQYKDVLDMNSGIFITAVEAQLRFGLLPQEHIVWAGLVNSLERTWRDLLAPSSPIISSGEWIGVFPDRISPHPSLICQTSEAYQPRGGYYRSQIPLSQPTYIVRDPSPYLVEIEWEMRIRGARYDAWGKDLVSTHTGFVRRVRIISITRGTKKSSILMYYGRVEDLSWDPNRYQWSGGISFMSFTSKLGRNLLKSKHVVPPVIERKWSGILPITYKLRWRNVWDKERAQKESGLLWATWHRSVSVNAWRGHFSAEVVQFCPVCMVGARETVLHRFWECPSARHAWLWATKIMVKLTPREEALGRIEDRGRRRTVRVTDSPSSPESEGANLDPIVLTWKQGIFAHRIPRRFKSISRIWLLLRGVVMWNLWKEHNDAAFAGTHWHVDKLSSKIWLGMVDYGRLAWCRVQERCKAST
jgi:hypothetical protein